MNTYPISPDDCLLLRALHTSRSLREAARLLRCDPTGLLRKAQRLSADTGALQKVDGKWRVTESGRRLAGWVEESIRSQRRLLDQESTLRLAATLWMAEQFVIPHLQALRRFLPVGSGLQVFGTEGNFEAELISGRADFVLTCHPPNDPAIAHKSITPEEWVVIVPRDWARRERIRDVYALLDRPFVRHRDLNPDLLLPDARLGSQGGALLMDSLIGVRAAVTAGLGWSFVPRLAVRDSLREGKVARVPHELEMSRALNVWWLRHSRASRALAPKVCQWAREASARA